MLDSGLALPSRVCPLNARPRMQGARKEVTSTQQEDWHYAGIATLAVLQEEGRGGHRVTFAASPSALSGCPRAGSSNRSMSSGCRLATSLAKAQQGSITCTCKQAYQHKIQPLGSLSAYRGPQRHRVL